MVLRNPDSFPYEPVMEKLLRNRNAQLVQVKRELAAAQYLAGRKASVGEAKERLNFLQELAGSFRRTQTSIEMEEEDPEASAAVHNYREEFNLAYYGAKDCLERFITDNIAGQMDFVTNANKLVDHNNELREAMRLLLNAQRVLMEDQLDRVE